MMLTILEHAGLAVALVLLVALHRRLSGLPLAVWTLARKEREAEAPKALDAMKESVATKAGAAVVAIRQYEEGIAASFRSQVAEAEMRARMGERRAAETHAALQAALALVRELRSVLEVVAEPRAAQSLPSSALSAAQPDEVERRTEQVSVPRITIEEEALGDDEQTRIGKAAARVLREAGDVQAGASGRGGG
jgi:hypothetical protein